MIHDSHMNIVPITPRELSIRSCSIADLESAPNIGELMAEYSAESSISDLGPVAAQWTTYKAMVDSGAMHPFAVFDGGNVLAGFMLLIISVLPHYGLPIAVSESFFVTESIRKTGAGLRLLREVERFAVERGAVGMLVSSPAGGRLSTILPRSGYKATNEVFFRRLA